MAYADLLKELLAKKNEKQGKGKKKAEVKANNDVMKDQVSSHKPAKKSAGRGR